MSDATSRRVVLQPSTIEIIFAWFQRVVSGYCLLFGILYWIRLIGFYPGPLWRFDLMPVHWQVAAVMLAVFFPFAAAGLWMLASWGPVIWVICAVTETVMYAGFPEALRPPPADRRLACGGGAALHRLSRGDLDAEAPDPAIEHRTDAQQE